MFSARRQVGRKQLEKAGTLICIVALIRLQKRIRTSLLPADPSKQSPSG